MAGEDADGRWFMNSTPSPPHPLRSRPNAGASLCPATFFGQARLREAQICKSRDKRCEKRGVGHLVRLGVEVEQCKGHLGPLGGTLNVGGLEATKMDGQDNVEFGMNLSFRLTMCRYMCIHGSGSCSEDQALAQQRAMSSEGCPTSRNEEKKDE